MPPPPARITRSSNWMKGMARLVTVAVWGGSPPEVRSITRRAPTSPPSGRRTLSSAPVAEGLFGSVEVVGHAGEGGVQVAGADGLGQGGVLVEDAVDAVGVAPQGAD